MQHKQYASGSDLANYMLDTYNTANLAVDEKSLGNIATVYQHAHSLTDPLSIDRVVELLSLYPSEEPSRKSYIHNAFR